MLPLLIVVGVVVVIIVLVLVGVPFRRRGNVLDEVQRFHHARSLTTTWSQGTTTWSDGAAPAPAPTRGSADDEAAGPA